MFKNNWEKTDVIHYIDDQTIRKMIFKAYPDTTISSYTILSGGCANLNIKLIFDNDELFLLRIYIRDKDAVYREQQIAKLLKGLVPIPQVFFIGNCDNYRYAITEFMHGITLRDFLNDNSDSHDMSKIMYDCGKMLVAIANYTFEKSGFFDNNLHINKPSIENEFQTFIEQALQKPHVVKQLSKGTIDDIAYFVKIHANHFPELNEKYLVHGDYDPANILVIKQGEEWEISAVLDFEFAFSGSWLWDVSNMLRYAHKMPQNFEIPFLKGIIDSGFVLPRDWSVTIKLLNLMSLLDSLSRYSVHEKPNQSQDIYELIEYIIYNKE